MRRTLPQKKTPRKTKTMIPSPLAILLAAVLATPLWVASVDPAIITDRFGNPLIL